MRYLDEVICSSQHTYNLTRFREMCYRPRAVLSAKHEASASMATGMGMESRRTSQYFATFIAAPMYCLLHCPITSPKRLLPLTMPLLHLHLLCQHFRA